MLKIIFILVQSFVLVVDINTKCDCKVTRNRTSSSYQSRIIGGDFVQRGDYTFTVALVHTGSENEKPSTRNFSDEPQLNMEYICAGTLISPSWVVLARHCFLENYKQLIKSNKLAIALGDNDLKNMMIQNISVAISLAEDIEESASVLDLMLIKLQHPVQMGVSVKPACLLNYDKLYRFRGKLISLGWGSTIQSIYSKVLNHWSSSPTPNQLKQVQMTDRYENLKCRGRLDLICVNGLVQDSGPCLGDSGGPLILQIEQNGYLIGSLTGGEVKYDNQLQPVTCIGDGIYTRIAYYMEWIKDNVDEPLCILNYEDVVSQILKKKTTKSDQIQKKSKQD